MRRIVTDSRVVEFLESRIGKVHGPHCVIGVEDSGEIIAGALFERCNGKNAFLHCASDGKKRWASKEFVRAVFSYPFVMLGYERLSTVLASSNEETMAFDLHIGFTEEARLKNAAHDGSDQVFLVMWKKDCKWLNF